MNKQDNIVNLKAKKILAEALSLNYWEINDKASPTIYDNWDSLNHVKLIMLIESEIERKLEIIEILSIDNLEKIKKIIS